MKRKIAAILAADVAGYSKLVAEDEEETLRRLAVYRSVFADFVERHGGRIFNTAGDAVLAEFSSAVDAVRCAVDVQETLRARNVAYPASRHMNFRIGITIGDVVERDGDLLGDGVNVAARLEGLAAPGGICISRSVHEVVASKLSLKFADAGMQKLKNMPEPVHAYTVAAGPAADQVAAPSLLKMVPRLPPQALAAAGALAVLAAGVLYWMLAGSEPDNAVVSPPPPPAATDVPQKESEATTTEADAKLIADCREGRPAVALAACKELIATPGLAKAELAKNYAALGRAQRASDDPAGAIKSFTQSIKHEPTVDAYLQRGIAHFDKRQTDEAIADLSEAIRLDPKSAEAANARAWIRFQAGILSPALEDANLAIEIDKQKASYWDTRGHINESLGRRDAAIRDFLRALEIDPAHENSKAALTRLRARE